MQPETSAPDHTFGLSLRIAVSVAAPDAELQAYAQALAAELSLTLAARDAEGFDLLLVVAEHGLELRQAGGTMTGPLRVKFPSKSGAHPKASLSRRQPIALAVGLKRHRPTVVDATAGLGQDAWLLACLGCTVTLVERSPVLGAMLRDALERAAADRVLGVVIRDRIKLIVGDAREVLTRLPVGEAPEVVYLDPMFPPRKKAALPKKEMRILRRLVGDDPDAGELLEVARRVARGRVVVKRTLRTPPLAPGVALSYKGKIARYDVYLARGSGFPHDVVADKHHQGMLDQNSAMSRMAATERDL
ncbi:MAG: class I SAM-dependent methyltransferase [Planctomycetota bacterium]